MPKQFMSIRNKQYRGPIRPHIASNRKIKHAFHRGKYAYEKYGKSILDNPYNPGTLHEAWKKGYIEATQYKGKPIAAKAPEGLGRHKDSYVVVKRVGATKRVKADYMPKDRPHNEYLGYIKPGKNGKLKRFYVWSNNPPEDMWKNKIACKSYKPEKDVEST